MNYQELVSLVGGSNPQSASYEDIVSGIQSQYRPQTQFAPTRSLLDSMGTLVPDQPRIAYGSLLQAQPRSLPPSINLGATSIKNPDAAASLDSGLINLGTETANTGLGGGRDLSGTLVYNNDFTRNTGGTTGSTGSTGLGNTTSAVGAVTAGLGVLAGNSDLAKTGTLVNIGGQLLNASSAEDVFKTLGNVALGLSGAANAAGTVIGGATGNTALLANSLLSLTSPQLSALNSISNALTGYNFGDIVTGLAYAPEGSVEQYGILGASNIGNFINNSGSNKITPMYSQAETDQRTLEVLADMGDTEAATALQNQSNTRTGFDALGDYRTGRGASYFNLFTPVGGSAKPRDEETLGISLI
jgi:hypothetical protein